MDSGCQEQVLTRACRQRWAWSGGRAVELDAERQACDLRYRRSACDSSLALQHHPYREGGWGGGDQAACRMLLQLLLLAQWHIPSGSG